MLVKSAAELKGSRALELAAHAGRVDNTAILLDLGVDINEDACTAAFPCIIRPFTPSCKETFEPCSRSNLTMSTLLRFTATTNASPSCSNGMFTSQPAS